jgi:hypothetical protein
MISVFGGRVAHPAKHSLPAPTHPVNRISATPDARSSGRDAPRNNAAAAANPSAAHVCVLGGGVVGLTSALRIKQALPDVDVTVMAETFSDVSAT